MPFGIFFKYPFSLVLLLTASTLTFAAEKKGADDVCNAVKALSDPKASSTDNQGNNVTLSAVCTQQAAQSDSKIASQCAAYREIQSPGNQSLSYCKARDAIKKTKPAILTAIIADTAASGVCLLEYELLKKHERGAFEEIEEDPSPGDQDARAEIAMRPVPKVCGAAAAVDGAIELSETVKQLTNKDSGELKGINGKTSLGLQGLAGTLVGVRTAACAFANNKGKNPLCPSGENRDAPMQGMKKLKYREELAKQSAALLAGVAVIRGADYVSMNNNQKSLDGNIEGLRSNSAAIATQADATNPNSILYQGGNSGSGSSTSAAATAGYAISNPMLKPGSPLATLTKDYVNGMQLPVSAAATAMRSGAGGILNMFYKSSSYGALPSEFAVIKNEIENLLSSPNFSPSVLSKNFSDPEKKIDSSNTASASQLDERAAYSPLNQEQPLREPASELAIPVIADDIWHANSDRNIFQIVSDRYEVTQPRVLK